MSKIAVEFPFIVMIKDGDGVFDGKGEVYYQLSVDGHIVVDVSRRNHVSVNDGDVIRVNEKRLIERPSSPGSQFTVSGFLKEADGHLAGADDLAGRFNITHSFSDGWNPGLKNVLLSGKGVSANVFYKVSVESE